MELAPLPGNRTKDGLPCRCQSRVRVADNQPNPGQTALHETSEKLPPVCLLLGECHRNSQNLALTIQSNANGNQNGGTLDDTALSYLLVAGVQNQVRGLP